VYNVAVFEVGKEITANAVNKPRELELAVVDSAGSSHDAKLARAENEDTPNSISRLTCSQAAASDLIHRVWGPERCRKIVPVALKIAVGRRPHRLNCACIRSSCSSPSGLV
jgi:hypothetical protein